MGKADNMDRIQKIFRKCRDEKRKALVIFNSCGFPDEKSSEELIGKSIEAGADIIELGVPFSDPIAEGPVIQEADIRALSGGVTTDDIFDMVKKLREKTEIPLVFMTYLNPVFHYGYEAFFERCQDVGIDGIIIPDLPFEEKEEVDVVASRYGIDLISMIAPTSKERIRKIAKGAKGFLYVVSSMGVTGERTNITTDIGGMLKEIRSVSSVPAAVGFGIHTPDQAAEISKTADGVIVGIHQVITVLHFRFYRIIGQKESVFRRITFTIIEM